MALPTKFHTKVTLPELIEAREKKETLDCYLNALLLISSKTRGTSVLDKSDGHMLASDRGQG